MNQDTTPTPAGDRLADEPCTGCGQPFVPPGDSCLCATCLCALLASNCRLYESERDAARQALARIRATAAYRECAVCRQLRLTYDDGEAYICVNNVACAALVAATPTPEPDAAGRERVK